MENRQERKCRSTYFHIFKQGCLRKILYVCVRVWEDSWSFDTNSHSTLFILATMMACLLDVVSNSIHFLNYVAKPVQTVCIHVPLLHSHFKRGRFKRDMYEDKLLWVSLSLSGGRILGLFFDLQEVFTFESQRCYPGKFCEISYVNDSDKSAPAGLQSSLLCVEHVDKKGKPLLYLVFEYLDTDLKKYIDRHGRGPNNPIPPNTIQVSRKSFLPFTS